MKLVQNVLWLATNGIALCNSERDNSHFSTLADLRALDDQDLVNWLSKKRDKYVYSDIQNELLGLMVGRLLHEHVLKRIHKSKFFTIMCDETTNVSTAPR